MNEERTGWPDAPVADGGEPLDPAVEQKVVEIEETRVEMTGTVEEIGDRLDPRNIVQGAKESVRDATIGKVEQAVNDVTNTASQVADEAGRAVEQTGATIQQAGGGIVDTIRRNPVPAAMAGIGIGWLLMSNRSSGGSWSGSSSGSGPERWRDDRWGDARWGDARGGSHSTAGRGGYASYAHEPGSGSVGQRLAGSASDAADTIGRTAGSAVDGARDAVGSMPDQVGGMTREVGDQAGRMIEQSPLAVGAIALAVGTAIGMALPATRTEQRLMGDASQRAIDSARDAVRQPMHQMEQQASESAGTSGS